MPDIAGAHRTLIEGVAALRAATSADDRIATLSTCEAVTRQLDFLSIELIAGLARDGVFLERGYSRPALAVADLLGCDAGLAARRAKLRRCGPGWKNSSPRTGRRGTSTAPRRDHSDRREKKPGVSNLAEQR